MTWAHAWRTCFTLLAVKPGLFLEVEHLGISPRPPIPRQGGVPVAVLPPLSAARSPCTSCWASFAGSWGSLRHTQRRSLIPCLTALYIQLLCPGKFGHDFKEAIMIQKTNVPTVPRRLPRVQQVATLFVLALPNLNSSSFQLGNNEFLPVERLHPPLSLLVSLRVSLSRDNPPGQSAICSGIGPDPSQSKSQSQDFC